MYWRRIARSRHWTREETATCPQTNTLATSQRSEPLSELIQGGLTKEQLSLPSAARMYDYYLGGHHNLAIDREAADAAIAIYPEFPLIMQANRAFLRRAVVYLAEQGIDRFLDIGSGIPTVGNVHQIVQQINPSARVVYVDVDPVAVTHSTAVLRGVPNATIIEADLRQPKTILDHPDVRDLLGAGQPVALILAFVLHFVVDDAQARWVVRELRDALPPHSYRRDFAWHCRAHAG